MSKVGLPGGIDSTPAAAPGDERLRGILFLCAGAFVFTIQDVIIKLVSDRYPLPEVLAVRCTVALPILLLPIHFDGGLAGLRSRRLGVLLLRGALLLAYATYYLAVAALPLAEAVSLYYSAPLFIVMLSGPLLGERVGLSRWLALLAGAAEDGNVEAVKTQFAALGKDGCGGCHQVFRLKKE